MKGFMRDGHLKIYYPETGNLKISGNYDENRKIGGFYLFSENGEILEKKAME